jgi:hypothetical protein
MLRQTKRTPDGDRPNARAISDHRAPEAAIPRMPAFLAARSVGVLAAIIAWRTASWETPSARALARSVPGRPGAVTLVASTFASERRWTFARAPRLTTRGSSGR